ncbi:hypothetical protein CLG96_02205 [Sphingomonas oleivorans]|uniref:Uncharacterized protein n=1 Tax=Sphingomonas oleivorans TaxID=1735121 RepID=A0A2T5G1G4_9SPHN|nr:hypothetical protein [Sphingomonas oleivorans]PTQ12978.1 hypothetical protein CLG96_02205 [Sphingomonas oleivorans]
MPRSVLPRRITLQDISYVVHFALQQVPRSVLLDLRSKDRFVHDAALEQITKRIVARFEGYEIYGPPEGKSHSCL